MSNEFFSPNQNYGYLAMGSASTVTTSPEASYIPQPISSNSNGPTEMNNDPITHTGPYTNSSTQNAEGPDATDQLQIDRVIVAAVQSTDLNPLPPCVFSMLEGAEYLAGSALDNFHLLLAENSCQEAVYAQCFESLDRFNGTLWRSYIVRLDSILNSLKYGVFQACSVLLRQVLRWLHISIAFANSGPTFLAMSQEIRRRIFVTTSKLHRMRDQIKQYKLPCLEGLQTNAELNTQIRQRFMSRDVQGCEAEEVEEIDGNTARLDEDKATFDQSYATADTSADSKTGNHLDEVLPANPTSAGQPSDTMLQPNSPDPLESTWEDVINWDGD